MKKEIKEWEVLVEETLSRVVKVKAVDESEAEEIVSKMYKKQEIVLDSEDFSQVEIREVNCW